MTKALQKMMPKQRRKDFREPGKTFHGITPTKKKKKQVGIFSVFAFIYLSFCLFSVALFYENSSKFVPLGIITNYWVSLEQQVGF